MHYAVLQTHPLFHLDNCSPLLSFAGGDIVVHFYIFIEENIFNCTLQYAMICPNHMSCYYKFLYTVFCEHLKFVNLTLL